MDCLVVVESKRSRPPATIYGQVYLKMGVKQGGQVSDHFGNNIDLLFAHQLRGLITIPPPCILNVRLPSKWLWGDVDDQNYISKNILNASYA